MHLEDDPALEFEFQLAHDLGMTVRRLRSEIDGLEFLYWNRWYARRDARRQVGMGG